MSCSSIRNTARVLNPLSMLSVEVGEQPAPDNGRFGMSHARWTVIFAVLVGSLASMPLWMSIVAPHHVAFINAGLFGLISFSWVAIAVLALRNLMRLQLAPVPRIKAIETARQ